MDKLFKDLYQYLKRSIAGKCLLFFLGLVFVAFCVWNSLPDKSKEKFLGFNDPPSPPAALQPTNKVDQSTKTDNFQHPQTVSVPSASVLDMTEVPDLASTKGYVGLLKTDFTVDGASTLDTEGAPIDGYFHVNIPPSKGLYSSASVQYKKDFSPHIYISARVAGNDNIGTLEIQGLGIYFLIDNHKNQYYIWVSEQNEQKWKQRAC